MGNSKSVDRDRKADLVIHIAQFEHNLEELKAVRDQLRKSKDILMQKVNDLEGPSIKAREEVREWMDSAENKLEEVDQLIRDGEEEIAKRQPGGFRVKNQNCSCTLDKRIAVMKGQVDSLKQNGQFDVLVERVFVEADHIRLLKQDIDALQSARNDLMISKNALMRRVKQDMEGGEMKPLEIVRLWFAKVDLLNIEVDKLLRDAPVEIQKWSVREFSNSMFGETVEARLRDVTALKNEGNFSEVVERETAEPVDIESAESEQVSQVEDNLEALRRETRGLWGLKDEVIARVKSEEEGTNNKRLKHVGEWLRRVEAILAEADRLMLQDAPQEIEKLRLGDSSSDFGKRVEDMLKDVLHKIRLGNFSQVTSSEHLEQAIEIETSETVGSQSKLDEVWSVLMKPEVGILGLYGLGGVGKTTLLAHINNKFLRTPSDFDFVIWVVVSKDFSISLLQEEIGERIGIAVDDWKKKVIPGKAKYIHNVLRRKKFVLLLDDLWEKVHLEMVGVPLPTRQNGSKIVLTTRSEIVCSLMGARTRYKLQTLPQDQAWTLFVDNVGNETISSDPAIRPLAEMVVKECDGLPLALIVIARAMASCTTANEWRYALEDLQQSASDLRGIKDEVFSRLKLSYDRLPDDRYRSCFIYCALFPEDFKIHKDDLIDYWISEKLESDSDGAAHITRAKAYQIMRDLVNSCFLEEEGRYVKMHDMIRDMALWIACDLEKVKYNYLVKAGKQLIKAPDEIEWKGVKRASLMENSIQCLPDVSVCPGIQTLLLCRNRRLHKINGTIFQFSCALTVLNLSDTRLQVLPMEVTELYSLQYLNLSHTWIEQLPAELRRLKKLVYLNLEHNNLLSMIPKGLICSFLNLQVLRMFGAGFFHGVRMII